MKAKVSLQEKTSSRIHDNACQFMSEGILWNEGEQKRKKTTDRPTFNIETWIKYSSNDKESAAMSLRLMLCLNQKS